MDKTADSYLMIGDLSALSHLYVLNRNLPKPKHVESVIYNKHSTDFFEDIDGSRPFNFYCLELNPIIEVKEIVP